MNNKKSNRILLLENLEHIENSINTLRYFLRGCSIPSALKKETVSRFMRDYEDIGQLLHSDLTEINTKYGEETLEEFIKNFYKERQWK